MTFDWYRWIWSRLGGRPWTYIIRDGYHRYPVVAMFIVAWAVFLLDHFHLLQWEFFLWSNIGVLVGHLFWGTQWMPNQQGSYRKGISFERMKK